MTDSWLTSLFTFARFVFDPVFVFHTTRLYNLYVKKKLHIAPSSCYLANQVVRVGLKCRDGTVKKAFM